jgi:hypothetical protein
VIKYGFQNNRIFRYISGRIIKINLLSKGKEIEIIQVYAPQVSCTDVEKEAFTQQLEGTATGEYVNIMGDFNAQVGTQRNGYENIIGKFGEGTRNQE